MDNFSREGNGGRVSAPHCLDVMIGLRVVSHPRPCRGLLPPPPVRQLRHPMPPETKFASGNADVLMGAVILNENSRISFIKEEFFKHCDMPYIEDIQRMAFEIRGYEQRVRKINANTKALIEYLEKQPFIKTIHAPTHNATACFYKQLMVDEMAYGGIISLEFNLPFDKVYDTLNFAKGPSLGTEFTLLMPYVYLAHYDMIISKQGQEFLKQHRLPVDLLRISVGCENIEAIKNEFNKLNF